jgi:5,10-methylenetetrahydromethanopterin reductase
MRYGWLCDPWSGSVEALVAEARFAQEAGMDSFWLAQVWRLDVLTLIPHLASQAPGMEFGTSVVPTYLRHPMVLASQALTVNELIGGRLALGVGVMHKPLIEGMFEMSFEKPVGHMAEYLSILLPLLDGRPVDVSGRTVSYHGSVDVPGAAAPTVLVAALGPQMLRLCGQRTAGTILANTGPKTIADHVKPTLDAAAQAARRPVPRIVGGPMGVHVTDDREAARERAVRRLGLYGEMPSYRAMLDREGLSGPHDLVLIGSEAEVLEGLKEYETAGVTDLYLCDLASRADRDRTREFIRSVPGR